MKRIEKVANEYGGRSRLCAKCPFNTKPKMRCNEEIWKVCRASYIQGFIKGAEWKHKDNLKT